MMNKLRRTRITMSANSGEGHIPSVLSVIDILWVLYDRILKIAASNPKNPTRDKFMIANSTFSCWGGAWLVNFEIKIVIAPDIKISGLGAWGLTN